MFITILILSAIALYGFFLDRKEQKEKERYAKYIEGLSDMGFEGLWKSYLMNNPE